jgi:nucleotide-binding universal stress UspA family protein
MLVDPEELGMVKVLLAVDGSDAAHRAAEFLVGDARLLREPIEVELVNVRLPVPNIGLAYSTVVTHDMVAKYYQDEGQQALLASRELLDAAGVRYNAHILVGDVAETVVKHAMATQCRMIYIGTRGMSALANAVLGSIATKVVQRSPVPVVLVP